MSDMTIAAGPVYFAKPGEEAWGSVSYDDAMAAFETVLDHFDQEAVMEQEGKRLDMIAAARRYYDGNHVKPFKIKPGEPDDNVIVNLCRTIIDDGASWLFGDPETGQITFEVEDDDLSGDAGNWFDDLWEASGGLDMLKRIAKRGGISGHTFVRLETPDPGDLPRIVALKPEMMAVMTDPRDEDQTVAYKMEWITREKTPNSNRRQEYIYRQITVNAGDSKDPFWLQAEFRCPKRKTKREWELVAGPEGWPYPWSPIHDCANIEAPWDHYGLSDLEDIAWLNDNLNFTASNTLRILKFHAHPRTVGTGFSAREIQDTSIDAFWSIPNPEAKVSNLEMQSDLQSSMNFLEFIKNSFWTIGRGMDVSVYKDKIGQITNFALRVLAIRALQKMGDKRISYGGMLRDINTHAQELIGIEPIRTVINWPNPLPISSKEELENLSTEVAMEITSKQTASEERGRNWDKERGRIKQEKASSISLGEYVLAEFDRGQQDDDF